MMYILCDSALIAGLDYDGDDHDDNDDDNCKRNTHQWRTRALKSLIVFTEKKEGTTIYKRKCRQ